MLRTKDFLLLLVGIFFLAFSITSTIAYDALRDQEGQSAAVFLSQLEDAPQEAVITGGFIDRASNVSRLKERVALWMSSQSIKILPIEQNEQVTTVIDSQTNTPNDQGEQRCALYQQFKGQWDSRGFSLEEVEGARIVKRQRDSAVEDTFFGHDVVLELPVRNVSFGSPACIPSDVIGVALDGSLIRNAEVSLYGLFGPQTLIGYALDGFPIYGASPQITDVCGGAMVGNQYTYFISKEREIILRCFSAPPARLPI